MTKVILAEKPSVARDIARIVGAGSKRDGYLEGNGFVVTWALGHLVTLAEPADYNDLWGRRWSFQQLPMVPDEWKLKVIPKTTSQFKIVKRLLNDAQTDEVICATDAGREGENIFRLIYEHAGCHKPIKRLWISSLTPEAIKRGLQELKPGESFNDLADAAYARARADWLVGLNLTRAYTVHNNALCTIGRVQTPTLAMIVAREKEILNFKSDTFFELIAHAEAGFKAKYHDGKGKSRVEEKTVAEELYGRLEDAKTGTVTALETKEKRNRPPALYDLISLQREANKRFGYTAAKVLEYAQSLYEREKLITYPRTESRHISEDMVPGLPRILENLNHPYAQEALNRLNAGHKLSKTYVDKTKLTDHHGILPTDRRPRGELPQPLHNIYQMVVSRFIGIFLPDNIVEETTVTLDIQNETFIAKGTVTLQQGWKVLWDHEPRQQKKTTKKDDDEEEEQQTLPPLKKDDVVPIASMELAQKETRPPKRFTDATLLNAMKTAGRQIEDDALAEAMKAQGLGTPATRAEIIEKLIRYAFLERRKKNIHPTQKGIDLIDVVAEPLRIPELTAEWEQKLKDVEQGEMQVGLFNSGIVSFVKDLLEKVPEGPKLAHGVSMIRKSAGFKDGEAKKLGVCPKCKMGKVLATPKAYGCDQCDFIIWKTMASKKLAEKHARDLILHGKTGWISDFKSKAGKSFDARVKLDDQFKTTFDWSKDDLEPNGAAVEADPQEVAPKAKKAAAKESDTPPTCPKCGLGRIIKGKRGYGCNRFREGCQFVVWMEVSGKKLSEKQIHRLIEKGRTTLIKGFKSKSGRKFNAYLKLSEDNKMLIEVPPQSETEQSKSS